MIDYEAVRARMDDFRRSAERGARTAEARRASRRGGRLRLAAGTHLARLGLRLAGPAALRAALGDAR